MSFLKDRTGLEQTMIVFSAMVVIKKPDENSIVKYN